jgi:hypothetical protein
MMVLALVTLLFTALLVGELRHRSLRSGLPGAHPKRRSDADLASPAAPTWPLAGCSPSA